jgi:hypothetical protein
MNTTTLTFSNRHLAGDYTPTAIDASKANADILIKYANGGSFTIAAKTGVKVDGRGVKCVYGNGRIEVTARKLEQLRKTYTVQPDF